MVRFNYLDILQLFQIQSSFAFLLAQKAWLLKHRVHVVWLGLSVVMRGVLRIWTICWDQWPSKKKNVHACPMMGQSWSVMRSWAKRTLNIRMNVGIGEGMHVCQQTEGWNTYTVHLALSCGPVTTRKNTSSLWVSRWNGSRALLPWEGATIATALTHLRVNFVHIAGRSFQAFKTRSQKKDAKLANWFTQQRSTTAPGVESHWQCSNEGFALHWCGASGLLTEMLMLANDNSVFPHHGVPQSWHCGLQELGRGSLERAFLVMWSCCCVPNALLVWSALKTQLTHHGAVVWMRLQKFGIGCASWLELVAISMCFRVSCLQKLSYVCMLFW